MSIFEDVGWFCLLLALILHFFNAVNLKRKYDELEEHREKTDKYLDNAIAMMKIANKIINSRNFHRIKNGVKDESNN